MLEAHEFDEPLVLTTPHIRGQRVRDAQWLLSGHNRFANFANPIRPYKNSIDGEFGLASASATKIAKYWLGYTLNESDHQFGQQIYNLLKDKELPKEYLERRQARIKELNVSKKVKALKLAETQVGVKESPFGSNRQKYGEWYRFNGVPWCAIFISWCISHSGHYWKYSYVPSIVDDARYGHNLMNITYYPQPGDLVSYTFHGVVNAHVEFFAGWVDNAHTFYGVGGNTGPINMSNGGEVAKQLRHIWQVSHFIRLNF